MLVIALTFIDFSKDINEVDSKLSVIPFQLRTSFICSQCIKDEISDSLDGKVCLSRCSKGLVATLILDIFRLVVSRDCQCFGRWSEKVRGLVLG